MFNYLIQRLLIMIPTLLVISMLVFIIIQLPPGDFLSNRLAELQSQGDAVRPPNGSSFCARNTASTGRFLSNTRYGSAFGPAPMGSPGCCKATWGIPSNSICPSPMSSAIGFGCR